MNPQIHMRRLAVATAAGTLALAACGSGDDSSADPASEALRDAPPSLPVDTSSETPTTAGDEPIVSVVEDEELGAVLVDAEGMALYTADEEADGEVRCVDACTSFWIPLEPGDGEPTGDTGGGELGVAERPDGDEQVTLDGRLLYTFVQDSPDEITGDGFADDFGDQHLTWHVVLAGNTATSVPGDMGATGAGTVAETGTSGPEPSGSTSETGDDDIYGGY